jgi:hypothetical protein
VIDPLAAVSEQIGDLDDLINELACKAEDPRCDRPRQQIPAVIKRTGLSGSGQRHGLRKEQPCAPDGGGVVSAEFGLALSSESLGTPLGRRPDGVSSRLGLNPAQAAPMATDRQPARLPNCWNRDKDSVSASAVTATAPVLAGGYSRQPGTRYLRDVCFTARGTNVTFCSGPLALVSPPCFWARAPFRERSRSIHAISAGITVCPSTARLARSGSGEIPAGPIPAGFRRVWPPSEWEPSFRGKHDAEGRGGGSLRQSAFGPASRVRRQMSPSALFTSFRAFPGHQM